MKKIAFFPLTPLGDSIVQMGQLVEIHRLYAPCHITVFAIPLIAELYRNYQYCDEAVELDGKIRGPVSFREVPETEFDVVFNHGYHESWSIMLRQMKYKEAYGMEEIFRNKEECEDLFTRYVPLEYWKNVTLKKYRYVSEQMAEVIRLVNPDFRGAPPKLTESNYCCTSPEGLPENKYVLFLPGSSALRKYWPIEKYFQLAKFIEASGYTALFVIGPQDTVLKNDLQKSRYHFYDNLSLSELAFTAAHAELVIGNDSGPMHFAMAFGTPSVQFFSHSGADNWFQYDSMRHKVLMLPCGNMGKGCTSAQCYKTCIGKISLKQALEAVSSLLGEPMPEIRQIGYFMQTLIGDALVNLENLKALAAYYAPCEITVFCTENNRELFENYAFCDHVFCYTPGAWHKEDLPHQKFYALFNDNYEKDSADLLCSLNHEAAYGYETYDIPEERCKKIYNRYLPLSMWDDKKLRYETGVTEQGAALVRLVDPEWHCDAVTLAENTFVCDFGSNLLDGSDFRNTILFVPGASSKAKHWGYQNYFSLGKQLQKFGYDICFLLGPGEQENKAEIKQEGFRYLSNLSFREIAALFLIVPGVIGNDTGLMHLACAMGSKSITIAPYGTHFTWFPYAREKHRVCHPECAVVRCRESCLKHTECVRLITLDMILTEAKNLGFINQTITSTE